MIKSIISSVALIGAVATANLVSAQDFKMPAPSPTETIKQDFSTSYIEVTYSRPAMHGRKIFGDLVPFGKVWRTGANASTKITFGEEVIIEGRKIPAGSYSLYTIPDAKRWKIIINKNTGNWGTNGFDDKDDVAVFDVPVQDIPLSIQSFTIAIHDITINSCNLMLMWESTAIVIPIKADNNRRIIDYLESQMQTDKPPYQQAANYYLETNQNLNRALEYADRAIATNPKAFYLHWLKARVFDKLGKKDEALKEAQIAVDQAPENYQDEYKKNFERLKNETH